VLDRRGVLGVGCHKQAAKTAQELDHARMASPLSSLSSNPQTFQVALLPRKPSRHNRLDEKGWKPTLHKQGISSNCSKGRHCDCYNVECSCDCGHGIKGIGR
jgi:hypothetical protein